MLDSEGEVGLQQFCLGLYCQGQPEKLNNPLLIFHWLVSRVHICCVAKFS